MYTSQFSPTSPFFLQKDNYTYIPQVGGLNFSSLFRIIPYLKIFQKILRQKVLVQCVDCGRTNDQIQQQNCRKSMTKAKINVSHITKHIIYQAAQSLQRKKKSKQDSSQQRPFHSNAFLFNFQSKHRKKFKIIFISQSDYYSDCLRSNNKTIYKQARALETTCQADQLLMQLIRAVMNSVSTRQGHFSMGSGELYSKQQVGS